ncbi:MAG: hypothetical protein OXH69_03355 [Acidobacteria bacterium]|nr:hypothetical protein [Acidobacteriota bacterium]
MPSGIDNPTTGRTTAAVFTPWPESAICAPVQTETLLVELTCKTEDSRAPSS